MKGRNSELSYITVVKLKLKALSLSSLNKKIHTHIEIGTLKLSPLDVCANNISRTQCAPSYTNYRYLIVNSCHNQIDKEMLTGVN